MINPDTIEALRESTGTKDTTSISEFREKLERIVGTNHLSQDLRDVLFNKSYGVNDRGLTINLYLRLVDDLGIKVVPRFTGKNGITFMAELAKLLTTHGVALVADRASITVSPRNGDDFEISTKFLSNGTVEVELD